MCHVPACSNQVSPLNTHFRIGRHACGGACARRLLTRQDVTNKLKCIGDYLTCAVPLRRLQLHVFLIRLVQCCDIISSFQLGPG